MVLKPSFGNYGVSVLVNQGEYVEDSENPGDKEMQHPNHEMAPRTNPILRSGLITGEQCTRYAYLRPEPKILDSGDMTEGSIRPSLSRNRVGSYVCGSG